MATKAELKARLTLDKSLFDAGIHSAQAGARRLSAGLVSVANIGARAMGFSAAAAVGLGTGIAYGTKKAFDLGSSLKELSSRTGVLPGKLLVLQRAFKDAGLEADDVGPAVNRMQKYIQEAGDKGLKKFGLNVRELKRLDAAGQFFAIGKAITSIKDPAERAAATLKIFGKGGGKLLDVLGDPKAMEDAQRAVGSQAAILNKNANLFDQIADRLNHVGTKLSGFFVGVANGLANTLAPILDRLDGIDLAGIGQKFGAGLVAGAQALVGLFANPSALFDTAANYFQAAMLGVGNVLIASFKTGIDFFKDGMINVLAGLGSVIISTLLQAFQTPIAYFQAGIEKAMEAASDPEATAKQFAKQRELEGVTAAILSSRKSEMTARAEADKGDTKGGQSALMLKIASDAHDRVKALSARRKDLLKEIEAGKGPSIEERANRILKEGVKFGLANEEGFGGGMTAEQWRKQGTEQANVGMGKATQAARNFKVEDVLGANDAMGRANTNVRNAMVRGKQIISSAGAGVSTASAASSKWDRFSGFKSELGELNKHMGPATTPFGFAGAGGDLGGMSKAYAKSPQAYKVHPDAYDQSGAPEGGEEDIGAKLDSIDSGIGELVEAWK